MRLEAEQNRIGDDKTGNTAEWICTEGLKRFPDRGKLYTTYAVMEMQYRSVQAARDALRKVLQDSSYSIGGLAILEFFCGNIDSGDDFCMLHLMEQLEKRYTQEAFIYLYHCCILLGWEEDAESYHKRMMRCPDYRPSVTYIEEFIRVCRERIV